MSQVRPEPISKTVFAILNMHRRRHQNAIRSESLEARQLLAASDAFSMAEGETEQVADFELLDVNPTSSTYNQTVSPRDYLGQVSAWYFGQST